MPRDPKVVDVEPVARTPVVRRVLLLILVAVVAAWIYVSYNRTRLMQQPPASAEATGVRSTVSPAGDSLQVEVDWELTVDSLRAAPESIRVEVGLSGSQQTSVSTRPADQRSDTLRIAAPAPGQTASGYSCVAPIHRGQLRREACTPWQFVQPAFDTASTAPGATGSVRDTTRPTPPRRTTAARTARVTRIVLQPAGLQVDPDPEGRCGRWQRENPARSVWVEVNRKAIPECTGVNGKPMVAQFCAFAELDDGSRIKTENSATDQYCDRLFRDWAGQRIS